MRTFVDAQGGRWQAALLEGSYGSVELIFGSLGTDQTLHRPLDTEAATFADAEQRLAEIDEAGLRAWLSEATAWP